MIAGDPCVLVTGADGFVGRALCAHLVRGGARLRAATRGAVSSPPLAAAERLVVGNIDRHTHWDTALRGVTEIIHLAARVHVMRETAPDAAARYREVNVDGTRRLAEVAAANGVRRLVYVSTIKVNGDTTDRAPFTEKSPPCPEGPYAVSKWEAEQALWKIADRTGLEVVVVRPPLIYGPGVRGNLRSLFRAVELGLPLPLGACDNRRSLLGLDNLVEVLRRCLATVGAAGETLLVSDGADLSTADLVRAIAKALGQRPRLVSVPTRWLRAGAHLLRREAFYDRLCRSLQVDSQRARSVLGWDAAVSVDEGLTRTARWYRSCARTRSPR